MNRNSVCYILSSIVQKDACGQTESSGPACCTNEIFNSYALSLGTDLKILFDAELNQLKELLESSNKQIDGKKKSIILFILSIM